MTKVYVTSKIPDAELEKKIYEMDENQLRTLAYGIARGWDFDETIDTASKIPTVCAICGTIEIFIPVCPSCDYP